MSYWSVTGTGLTRTFQHIFPIFRKYRELIYFNVNFVYELMYIYFQALWCFYYSLHLLKRELVLTWTWTCLIRFIIAIFKITNLNVRKHPKFAKLCTVYHHMESSQDLLITANWSFLCNKNRCACLLAVYGEYMYTSQILKTQCRGSFPSQ